MKNAVVFGGAGFIGSHVADALSEAGYRVQVFDIESSPYLRDDQRMIVGDITDAQAVRAACEGQDFIYNFAGLADIDDAKDKPLKTAQLNIMGNLNLLEAAREVKAKRFVFASTVYVYSESGSFYRASKQSSERFVELYSERFDLDFTILRYGSLYGRRSDRRNNIYRLIEDALETGKMVYKGSGQELREYIHVIDAATASVEILADQYRNRHIVLTGHQPMRVGDLMKMISEILENKIEISFEGQYAAHYSITPYAYKPRPGKKLAVNPFVDLGQGVLDCIHEFEEKKESKNE